MYKPVGIFYAYWTHKWDVDFLLFVGQVKTLGFDQLELHAAVLEGKNIFYRLKIHQRTEKTGIALSYGMDLDMDFDL